MATQNAINKKTQDLTIDPGASGDSYCQFDIAGTGEFRIGVDDTDDSFRISQGSALGTNDTFVMSDAGERILPLQPAFGAVGTANQINVTGHVTTYTILFNGTEYFDQGGDFVHTTGIFTAPVTGRYQFNLCFALGGLIAASNCQVKIVTSNKGYSDFIRGYAAIKNAASVYGAGSSVLADMDAADTCVFQVYSTGEGSNINDIVGANTFCSGFLVC